MRFRSILAAVILMSLASPFVAPADASVLTFVCERILLPMNHKIGAPKRAVSHLWGLLRTHRFAKKFRYDLFEAKKALFKEKLKDINFEQFVFDSKETVQTVIKLQDLLLAQERTFDDQAKKEGWKPLDEKLVERKKKEYLDQLNQDYFRDILGEFKYVEKLPLEHLVALRGALKERDATMLDVSRPETKLAFIEAVVEQYPLEFRTSIALLKGRDYAGKLKLKKLLSSMNLYGGMTRKQVEKAMAQFYLLTHGDPFLETNASNAVLARLFQEKISTNGMFQTLDALKLAEPETIREKIKAPFTHRYFKLGLNVTFNLISMGLWVKFRGVILPGAPEAKWVEWKKMDSKLIDKIAAEGLTTENWAELRKTYGRIADIDVGYQSFKRTYGLVASIITLYFFYEIIDMFLEMREEMKRRQIEAEKAVDEQINLLEQQTEAIRDEIKQHKDIREELFDDWKADYKKTHKGRDPDPKSKEYVQTHDLIFGSPKP